MKLEELEGFYINTSFLTKNIKYYQLGIIKTRKLSLNIQSIAYYCLIKALLMQ